MIYHNASLHWSYSNFAGLPYALQLTIEQSSARAMVRTGWPGGRECNATAGPLGARPVGRESNTTGRAVGGVA